MAFRRTGEGPPLLLLHGLGGEGRVWTPVVERLRAHRDVVAVDLPGFGRSPALGPDEPPTAARIAGRLAGLLDELGWERPHVAGNSLGGWIALELAALGRAAGVTAVAPAGLWSGRLAPRPYPGLALSHALAGVLPTLLRGRRLRAAVLSASVAHPERVPAEEAVAMVLAYAGSTDHVRTSNAMRSGRFEAGDRIDVPVTYAWCARDRLIARPRSLPVPGREVVLPDCGHVPMWDDPDAVAELLLADSGG